MKSVLYTALALCVFAGIPVLVQTPPERRHIIAETLSLAWRQTHQSFHQRETEERAVRGSQILRRLYVLTPSQTLRLDSVLSNSDGDVCYAATVTDARGESTLAFAIFEHDATVLHYGLDALDLYGVCADGRDLTDVLRQ